MAGYSRTPLERKFGIRPGHVVLLDRAPDTLELDVPGAHVVRRLPASVDVTLTFQRSRADLAARLPRLIERTTTDGMIWVCWPKKAAQRSDRNPAGVPSDLDGNVVREVGLGLSVVDVKVAAIDDTWSALKFVRRLTDR